MKLPHVELQADDGEHEDGHEQQQADLQQGDHGLHDRLEHHLQAWRTQAQGVQWADSGGNREALAGGEARRAPSTW